ncbi:hypothetical protein BGX34_005260 [Mortierella sp. NVP85]|nr:hypothetical protein BGX34_005260 [Mortierella sp. NVP85]
MVVFATRFRIEAESGATPFETQEKLIQAEVMFGGDTLAALKTEMMVISQLKLHLGSGSHTRRCGLKKAKRLYHSWIRSYKWYIKVLSSILGSFNAIKNKPEEYSSMFDYIRDTVFRVAPSDFPGYLWDQVARLDTAYKFVFQVGGYLMEAHMDGPPNCKCFDCSRMRVDGPLFHEYLLVLNCLLMLWTKVAEDI